jgi:ATP-dependent DNA helicase RecQ
MSLISALTEALAGQAVGSELPPRPLATWTPDYAVWRFLKALRDSPTALTDHAILLRQALRWSGLTHLDSGLSSRWSSDTLHRVGIVAGNHGHVRVVPLRPSWWLALDHSAATSLDGPPRLQVINESEPAEPWLASLRDHLTWRSPAQKDACWAALTAREGGTSLIALPTGAGKSLAFQVVTRFSKGLTLVVVPTIALAIDHSLSALHLFQELPGVNPLAYESTQRSDGSIRDAIRNRSSRLIFASPEACVSGSLCTVLGEAAQAGWLRTVVIDEAHIVETWGADFRVDFQLLSNTLVDWRQRSNHALRTILLSATFSDDCQQTLKALFAPGTTPWSECVSQRLRPEMNYFCAPFETDPSRQAALVEAIYQLPRPAIVYVTEVNEANALFEICRAQMGLQRVECFTGDTPPRERRRILSEWRADALDLMIATSAFGMGVDKPDIRAVVHACVPETLDRYYQEVGRGGRDGASVTCLLMPSTPDWEVAKGLTPTLLGDEKIRLRWQSLWNQRQAVPGAAANVFDLPLNVRHKDLFGARSYRENIQWNKRLLLLLVRAGYARLIGSIRREELQAEEAVPDESARVEVKFSTLEDITALIGDRRNQEVERSAKAQQLLESYVFKGEAICRVLLKQYGSTTARACGSCQRCRSGEVQSAPCRPLELQPMTKTQPTVELVLGLNDFNSARHRDEVVMLLRNISRQLRVRRFFCPKHSWRLVRDFFEEAFATDGSELYRLDAPLPGRTYPVGTDERIICIHAQGYDPVLEEFNRAGKIVTHLVPSGKVKRDANGRWPLLSEGAQLYTDADQWFSRTARPQFGAPNSTGPQG